MAIDYGTKRCGIAVTDSLQIISSGLSTINSKDLIVFLKQSFKNESVECVVVGEPKQMNNEPSQSAEQVNLFLIKFKKEFPNMKLERMDERFTSKMAFQTMIDGGLKKQQRRNNALVDEISATLILQSYMEAMKNKQHYS